MDDKIKQLEQLNFQHKTNCMTNGKYLITYVQIDECKENDWKEFINIISLESTE
jgi:major membrane immunogen (membrane-anchored lipoprotein)